MSALVHVVDDEPEIRNLIREALELEDHQTEVFEGGGAYLAEIDQPPDILLLDLIMPDPDGWEVANRVRDRWSPAPPILAVTACFGSDLTIEDLQPEFDGVLGKPFRLEELVEAVENQLGSST